jgi:hypothetical protein
MHTSRLRLVLLFIFGIAVPSFSVAQTERSGFTLVNMTGSTIREIYLSPTRKHDWGFDRLGKKVLPDGASRFFKLRSRPTCGTDIKVVFVDATPSTVWPNVDLCAINRLTLRYDRQTRKVTAIRE